MNRIIQDRKNWLQPMGVIEYLTLFLSLLSLAYAVTTAPLKGIDIRYFQEAGEAWAKGIYHFGEGPISEYPPFTLVLFTPLSWVPFHFLRISWLALNLMAASLILLLVIQYFGKDWPFKARFYLCALFLSWAPLRVTLRNGQLSLIITALILLALVAERRGRKFLAGILLGFSLCKYTLSFPFFIYYLWRREWKMLGSSLLVPVVFTEIYALCLKMSLMETVTEYGKSVVRAHLSSHTVFVGTTEIKPLIFDLTRGKESLTAILTVALAIVGLSVMAVVFARRPKSENIHVAILALFSLWSVYHKTYDSVLCVIAAAILIDLVVRRNYVWFGVFGLTSLALFALSIPGLLLDRLGLDASRLAGNTFGFVGIHLERTIVLCLFVSFLILLGRADPSLFDLSSYENSQ